MLHKEQGQLTRILPTVGNAARVVYNSSQEDIPEPKLMMSPEKHTVGGLQYQKLSNYYNGNGNQYYMQKNFEKAGEEYTRAIFYAEEPSRFYSNRALCYIMMKKWQEALEDCKTALKHDTKNIKALVSLASSLIEMEKKQGGTFESMKNFGVAVESLVEAMKLAELNVKENKNIIKEVELKLRKTRKMYEIVRKSHADNFTKDTLKCVHELLQRNESDSFRRYEFLHRLNEMAMDNNEKQNSDIPDYLTCKISYELMKEPVITPDGISYEKQIILEHFERVGYFDPVTRKQIDSTMLVPNQNLKSAISNFYEKNPLFYEPEKTSIEELD
jgi:STIP1 family protein 1